MLASNVMLQRQLEHCDIKVDQCPILVKCVFQAAYTTSTDRETTHRKTKTPTAYDDPRRQVDGRQPGTFCSNGFDALVRHLQQCNRDNTLKCQGSNDTRNAMMPSLTRTCWMHSNTSDSQLKNSTTGTICNMRHGARHILRALRRSDGKRGHC